jgi:hypothetical protein
MNVIFHLTTSFTIAVVSIRSLKKTSNEKVLNKLLLLGFILSIISHGILDLTPHCYPINSKVDVIVGILLILSCILLVAKRYILIFSICFAGSILPDLIDLSPKILNKYFNLSLPVFQNIFPWHWKNLSGSVYINSCQTSNAIHIALLLIILNTLILNRKTLKLIFHRI